jgi:hypothetical protein
MTDSAFHLAQVNIGRVREPIGSPLLADFVAALAPINALADASPGFVWRLQTEDGNATSIRPFEDDRMMVNLSVWESVETLADFTYRTVHADVMRRRREWFHHLREMYLALWWVPAGHQPSVEEARERLEYLQRHGPTPHAFTFREPFGPPGSSQPLAAREDDLCPI